MKTEKEIRDKIEELQGTVNHMKELGEKYARLKREEIKSQDVKNMDAVFDLGLASQKEIDTLNWVLE